MRSISTSPIVSEIHFAACGSLVRRKILVAGCDSIASASWPYRVSSWLRPWNPSTTGLFDFRFSVTAVWSCGSRCRLASSSRTNHTGRWPGWPRFISRSTSMSSHRLVSGHETRACLRRAREEQPAATVARPRRGTPALGRLRFTREQLQRIRHHVERGEHAAALRGRLPVDDRRVRRPVHTAIELLVVTQPGGQFFGGRPERQQVRKDAPRAFREERILVDAIGKERRGERERFGLVAQLVAGAPVRRPRVERIENHVTAFWRVELRRVFERRVVHDGGVAAVLELTEELSNQRRLAGAGVAHDEQMARLDGARNRQRRLDAQQLGRQARHLDEPRCRSRACGG